MSDSADIRAVWISTIWGAASVLALTPNALMFAVGSELKSTDERAALYDAGRVNFFSCAVSREAIHDSLKGSTGLGKCRHIVRVHYVIQRDYGQSDQSFNLVADRLELVDDLVRTSLGQSWGGTVDYYRMTGIRETEAFQIAEVECWRGGYEYEAISQT